MNQHPARTYRLAEDIFRSMCSEGGVVANRVEDDSNGWDFFVEYPAAASDRPADISEPGLSCLVQIKSNRTGGRSCQMKLSNALRFARKPHPCFVVLMVFEPDGRTVKGIYLRHFWKTEIAAALKGGRQAHADGQTSLNRLKFPMHFSDGDFLPKESVVDAIAAQIRSVGPQYEAQKVRFGGAVGYEDGYGTATFNVLSTATENFVDVMLGLSESVSLKDFVAHERRFGIADRKPLSAMSDVTLFVEAKPVAEVIVVAKSPDGTRQIDFPGEVYAPGIPNLPDEYKKVRIKTACLDLVVREAGEIGVNASFDPSERMPLELVDKVVTLWSWLPEGEIDLEVWHNGKLFLWGAFSANTKDHPHYWKRLAFGTNVLAGFVPDKRFPADLAFNVVELMEHLHLIVEFAAVTSESGTTIRVGGGACERWDALKSTNRFLMQACLELPGSVFFAVVLNSVQNVTLERDQVAFRLENPKVLRPSVLKGEIADHMDFLRAEIRRARDSCPGGTEGLVATDFAEPDPLAVRSD